MSISRLHEYAILARSLKITSTATLVGFVAVVRELTDSLHVDILRNRLSWLQEGARG